MLLGLRAVNEQGQPLGPGYDADPARWPASSTTSPAASPIVGDRDHRHHQRPSRASVTWRPSGFMVDERYAGAPRLRPRRDDRRPPGLVAPTASPIRRATVRPPDGTPGYGQGYRARATPRRTASSRPSPDTASPATSRWPATDPARRPAERSAALRPASPATRRTVGSSPTGSPRSSPRPTPWAEPATPPTDPTYGQASTPPAAETPPVAETAPATPQAIPPNPMGRGPQRLHPMGPDRAALDAVRQATEEWSPIS